MPPPERGRPDASSRSAEAPASPEPPPRERPAELPPEKPGHRSVSLERRTTGHYTVTNARGDTLSLGEEGDFTSVELLLAGIAGCTAIDVDHLTVRRAEPQSFVVDVAAEKVADERGNHLEDIVVTFRVRYPDGNDGDAARSILPDIVAKSHDRLCTVSRTITLGTDITTVIE
ncbi:OsmC family protein [Lapillicoccus sp.]|uniref:OsmC family protein n=1 Tax=Lapillicoccus sp. TaxID=1909287 RepID=UPI003263EBA6